MKSVQTIKHPKYILIQIILSWIDTRDSDRFILEIDGHCHPCCSAARIAHLPPYGNIISAFDSFRFLCRVAFKDFKN